MAGCCSYADGDVFGHNRPRDETCVGQPFSLLDTCLVVVPLNDEGSLFHAAEKLGLFLSAGQQKLTANLRPILLLWSGDTQSEHTHTGKKTSSYYRMHSRERTQNRWLEYRTGREYSVKRKVGTQEQNVECRTGCEHSKQKGMWIRKM